MIDLVVCARMQEYLKEVVGKGQLLEIVKLVGNNKNFLKKFADPSKPPESIDAQKDPPKLRGPVPVQQVIAGGPTPNDPRFVVEQA